MRFLNFIKFIYEFKLIIDKMSKKTQESKKAFRNSFLLMLAALFGSLISECVRKLLSNLSDINNWIGFFVTIILIWYIIFILLKFFEKKYA